MAQRWQGRARFYIVFTEEAHPKGGNVERYTSMADMMRAADKNQDNQTTREEFTGPAAAFAPLDNNHDGVIQSHELLSARKVAQFAEVEPPTTAADRRALARRYRAELPGQIPVLLDDMQHSVRDAFSAIDNSAFVIDGEGRVRHRFMWAYVPDIDQALADLLGVQVPEPSLPRLDWRVLGDALARARAADRTASGAAARALLVHFTTPGCRACATMRAGALADPDVREAMARYEVVEAGLQHDPHWGLFEALGLSGTPAFVLVDPGAPDAPEPSVLRSLQGVQDRASFLSFLASE